MEQRIIHVSVRQVATSTANSSTKTSRHAGDMMLRCHGDQVYSLVRRSLKLRHAHLGVNELARTNVNEITGLVDPMIPMIPSVRFKRRPWIHCLQMTVVWRSELFVISNRPRTNSDPADVAAPTTTWTARRREYSDQLHKKREAFCKEKLDVERLTLRQLWCSVDKLMGREQTTTSARRSSFVLLMGSWANRDTWVQLHLYADDTQIYGFFHPGDSAQLQSHVSACVGDVGSWM